MSEKWETVGNGKVSSNKGNKGKMNGAKAANGKKSEQKTTYAMEDVMLSKLITDPVCILVSIFLEPMLRSCLLNGSSKLDPVKVSPWAMIYGLVAFCCIAVLRNLAWLLQWIPSLCR